MFLGVELARTAVKALLVDEVQNGLTRSSAPLTASRPQQSRAELSPENLWEALRAAIRQLRKANPQAVDAIKALAIGSDLHGVILVDAQGRPLRTAILDEDRRTAEGETPLEPPSPGASGEEPQVSDPATAIIAWLQAQEPKVLKKAAKILQPKDYLILGLTGQTIADASDSAWTRWVDAGEGNWSHRSLSAAGLSSDDVPQIGESTRIIDTISPDAAADLGLPKHTAIAVGTSGDAARALSVGALEAGSGFISLGEAGALMMARSSPPGNPVRGLVRAPHAIEGAWYDSAPILDAAGCLAWLAGLTGASNEQALLAEAGQVDRDTGSLIYLPFRSGATDPFDDPNARGVLFGLVETTRRADLTRAVLEGMALAFAEGKEALEIGGTHIGEVSITGSDVRSPFWGRILASALGTPLMFHKDGSAFAAALGAARVARMAVTGEAARQVCLKPPVDFVAQPVASLSARYATKRETYRRLFRTLQSSFAELP